MSQEAIHKPVFAVIGGGTTGLLAASLLANHYPDKRIVIIEKNATVGGLLRSFDYDENGYFDYGAHNFQETLIPEIDNLFLNLIPKDQWHILPGEKREIAGNYFKGALRFNTPFMDLRHLPERDYQACIQDFFLNINGPNGSVKEYPEDAYGFSVTRYGKTITDLIIAPAVQKLFGQDIQNIHRLPLNFLPLSRICFLNDDVVTDLTKSDILRERLAYTDQRKLPLERSSGKRIFYPKTLGMQQLIDGFTAKLQQQGVEIWTNANVTNLALEQGTIKQLTVEHHQQVETLAVENVFWTAGIHPLAKTLDLFYPQDSFDKPLKTVFAHYHLDHRLALEDIYFLYPFDPGFMSYRVVNYANYCPQAAKGPKYPVTLEMFLKPDQNLTNEEISKIGFEEIKRMGLVPEETKILFSAVETTSEGFPMPTLKNMALTKTRRERIEALAIKNLSLLGILAKDDLLFHKDIILDTYEHIQEMASTQKATSKTIQNIKASRQITNVPV